MAEESLPVYRAAESWTDVGCECILASAAYRRSGDLSRARELVVEALSCGRHIDDHPTLAGALEQAAALHAAEGEHKEALRLYGAALRWRQTTGDRFDADDDAATLAAESLSAAAREALIAEGSACPLVEVADRAWHSFATSPRPGPIANAQLERSS
jgi:hypothetical protein